MTGIRLDRADFFPDHVMSPDEFAAAQSIVSVKPVERAGLPSRVLSPEEFEQVQGMGPKALARLKLPAIAPRDVTSTGVDRLGEKKGKKIDGILGEVLKQTIDPVLEHPIQSAAIGAALTVPVVGPLVGAGMAGSMVHNIASYGWQKAAEMSLPEDVRKFAEADPERISGEAAAVQAAMLGLAPLIHVGVKNYRALDYVKNYRALDYSTGMMEAGAKGAAAEARAGSLLHSNFNDPRFTDAYKNERFASAIDEGANPRIPLETPKPEGFTPTAATVKARTTNPRAPEGMIAPEAPTPGRVKPLETLPANATLEERAGYDQAKRDYEAQRLEQDQADLSAARAADAEKIAKADAMRPRRRAKGEPSSYFESPQGAETLGAMAARHGLPNDANPYHPASPLAESWSEGHGAATESFPEGFSMGGSLADSRIPADFTAPRVPGYEPTIPEGASPQSVALANALKPSRFRGHPLEDLDQAALDAQTAVEEAQAAVGQSATRGLTGEAALADFENRASSYAESESEGSTITADRKLAAAKSRLQQIEREYAIRGIRGDELADRIASARDIRAEREGIAQDEALDFAFGKEPEPAPLQNGGLAAVEGTGPTKVRGLSRGVQQKALANKLDATIGDLPEYRALSMADQSERAVQLLAENPALAKAVALGDAPAPHGLLPESVFVAVENAAIESGDVATIRELATGKLTREATTMGQRIRALGERDPDSPVAAIKKVIDVRMGGAKDVPKVTEEVVAALRKQLGQVEVKADAWAKFVDSLRCS